MKEYWPIGIAVTQDGPEQVFTYSCMLNRQEAEKCIDTWSARYKLAASWIDVIENDVKERIMLHVDIDYVKELWENFGDVPMNPETECIEKAWGDTLTFAREFPAGTHREEIWHWFEETFNINVVDLMWKESRS